MKRPRFLLLAMTILLPCMLLPSPVRARLGETQVEPRCRGVWRYHVVLTAAGKREAREHESYCERAEAALVGSCQHVQGAARVALLAYSLAEINHGLVRVAGGGKCLRRQKRLVLE